MSEKQYSPACYYWNCLNKVKNHGKFCSRVCMEDFIEIPPPWIDKDVWAKGDYSGLQVEEEKKRTKCQWCGGITYEFHKGKKRIPKCSKCVIRLRGLRNARRKRPLSRIRKCKTCGAYTNTYYRGKERPPYCRPCMPHDA